MRLFLILLAVPVIEIALFIEVGGFLGTWPTVGIVILTALAGSIMLRRQGVQALANVQARLAQGEAPGKLLADGVMIVFAAALLLTPGFFTDGVGFLLLVPGVRIWLFGLILRNIKFDKVEINVSGPGGARQESWGQTVDGEFEDITPKDQARPSDPGVPPRIK